MNLTQNPNLKPLRAYDEHDVIPFFAHVLPSVNKGTLVTVTTAEGNTNVSQDGNDTPYVKVSGSLANTPTRVTHFRKEISWKVKSAATGDIPLGITLYDVREVDQYGNKLIFQDRLRREEQDLVVSGEAVPILTKGIVKINGFVGTPGPNSGASVSSTSGKILVTNNPLASGNIGKFLTTADADGYAMFKIEL
jgi:hypothetical protein